jgi:polyisoprenoid-binding protein YceI
MRFSVRAIAAVVAGLAGTVAGLGTARAAETYQADAVHSAVVFRVRHMNTSHAWGRFNDLSGAFTLDSADPSQCKFEFKVKAGSVDTGNAARDNHVKGPDFLNAVQFPTIAFKSTSVSKSGSRYEVSGDLTLHGVTKPVTIQLTPTGTGKGPTGAAIAGIDAVFTVKRSEFGMTKMVGPVGDDVWLNVSVEGIRK